MGKGIYIYDVDFELLRRHVPGFMEGMSAMDALRDKVKRTPEDLTGQDYDNLFIFLNDHVLAEQNSDDELKDLGLICIKDIHPSYMAIVFMELLRELMPDTEYNGLDLYRLSREELLMVMEILMLYKELFDQYEDSGNARAFEISPFVREKFTISGKQLLEREIEKRNALGEDDYGKLYPQYFHFFIHIDPEAIHAALLKGKGNVCLIVDSY